MRRAALVSVATLAGLSATAAQTTSCPEDLTGDGVTSTNDLLYLLASFGRDATSQLTAVAADLDGVRAHHHAPPSQCALAPVSQAHSTDSRQPTCVGSRRDEVGPPRPTRH